MAGDFPAATFSADRMRMKAVVVGVTVRSGRTSGKVSQPYVTIAQQTAASPRVPWPTRRQGPSVSGDMRRRTKDLQGLHDFVASTIGEWQERRARLTAGIANQIERVFQSRDAVHAGNQTRERRQNPLQLQRLRMTPVG